MCWLTKLLLCSFIFLSACFISKAYSLSASIGFQSSLSLVSDVWRSPGRCPVSLFSSCVERVSIPLDSPKLHTSGWNSSELQGHLAMVSFIGFLSGYLDFWYVQYYLLLCDRIFFPTLCLKIIMAANQPSWCVWESLCVNGMCCCLHQTMICAREQAGQVLPSQAGSWGQKIAMRQDCDPPGGDPSTHRGAEPQNSHPGQTRVQTARTVHCNKAGSKLI